MGVVLRFVFPNQRGDPAYIFLRPFPARFMGMGLSEEV